jgi:hypothetical protein
MLHEGKHRPFGEPVTGSLGKGNTKSTQNKKAASCTPAEPWTERSSCAHATTCTSTVTAAAPTCAHHRQQHPRVQCCNQQTLDNRPAYHARCHAEATGAICRRVPLHCSQRRMHRIASTALWVANRKCVQLYLAYHAGASCHAVNRP